MAKKKMKKFIIFTCVIFLLSIFVNFILPYSGFDKPKEKPYIENEILYLELSFIPIENITRIEIVRDSVLSVLIHHKKGICSLPFHEYLKISKYFWVGE